MCFLFMRDVAKSWWFIFDPMDVIYALQFAYLHFIRAVDQRLNAEFDSYAQFSLNLKCSSMM